MRLTRLVLIRCPIARAFDGVRRACRGADETGGILLGMRRGPHLDVIDLTWPGPEDIRTPTRFVRQDPSHQELATKAWHSSDRRVTCVGEWHTHPSGAANPSMLDRRAWNSVAQQANGSACAFVIVSPRGWRVWLLSVGRDDPIVAPLTPMARDEDGVVFC